MGHNKAGDRYKARKRRRRKEERRVKPTLSKIYSIKTDLGVWYSKDPELGSIEWTLPRLMTFDQAVRFLEA